MESPRLLDFAICRVFNGAALVAELGLVTTDDPRLTDARVALPHAHAVTDVNGLSTWMTDTDEALADKQPRGEYHIGLACVEVGVAI